MNVRNIGFLTVAISCCAVWSEVPSIPYAPPAHKPIERFYELTRAADLIVVGKVIQKTDNGYWNDYRFQVGSVLGTSPLQRKVVRNEDINVLVVGFNKQPASVYRAMPDETESVRVTLYKGGVYVLWLKKMDVTSRYVRGLGIQPETCYTIAHTGYNHALNRAVGVIPLSRTKDLPASEVQSNFRGGSIYSLINPLETSKAYALETMGLPETVNIVAQVKGLVVSNQQVLTADNEFSLEVLRKMSAGGVEKNLAVSPMSIRAAMALAWAGSAGKTAEQLEKALVIQKPDEFAAKYGEFLQANILPGVSIANSVWTADALLPGYARICNNDFHAGVFKADFAANPQKQRKRINNWISEETNKMIPELLKENDIDRDTRLVLANAIYFKELWLHKFKEKSTRKETFHVTDDKTVQADTMFLSAHLPWVADDNMMAVRLEYKKAGPAKLDERLDHAENRLASMIAIIPKDSTPEKLDKFIAGLTGENFRKIADMLKNSAGKVVLQFPKFKLDCRYELKELFQQLGVTVAFDGKQADFTKMTGEKHLEISRIIHQAVIDVNETGTEAAAATAVVIEKACEISQPKLIKFDRPFVFFIRDDRTGAIIFAGRVIDPTK